MKNPPSDRGGLRKIILNNGDGSDTEFDFRPDEKRAVVSLACVQLLLSRKDPERWKREFGGRPVGLIQNPLRAESLSGPPQRLPNVLEWKLAQRKEQIDGKLCSVLFQKWYSLIHDGGAVKTDRNTRFTSRRSVWVDGGIVLRDGMLSEYAGDEPPRPLVTRRVTIVRNLKLNPPLPDSLFELPPGTECTVFGDYAIRLPAGVKRRTLPGPGLEVR
jgi:hypothetical protein